MIARLMGLEVISPTALRSLVEEQRVTVIDVNSRESWNRAHVPGAANLDPVEYKANDLPKDKDAAIVFYCSNSFCRKAPNAAKRARALGYKDVRVMSAGIKGWEAKALPTETSS